MEVSHCAKSLKTKLQAEIRTSIQLKQPVCAHKTPHSLYKTDPHGKQTMKEKEAADG